VPAFGQQPSGQLPPSIRAAAPAPEPPKEDRERQCKELEGIIRLLETDAAWRGQSRSDSELRHLKRTLTALQCGGDWTGTWNLTRVTKWENYEAAAGLIGRRRVAEEPLATLTLTPADPAAARTLVSTKLGRESLEDTFKAYSDFKGCVADPVNGQFFQGQITWLGSYIESVATSGGMRKPVAVQRTVPVVACSPVVNSFPALFLRFDGDVTRDLSGRLRLEQFPRGSETPPGHVYFDSSVYRSPVYFTR
jgi:hypothetical protein